MFLKTRYALWGMILVLFSSVSYANLMISPTRVVFEDRDRSQTVYVINSSDQTKTYRFGLFDQQQISTGGYAPIKEGETVAGLNSAKDMIRFSPRQVTLQPGERQMVRLSLRKPANLAPGEYRSHLSFTELPNPERLNRQEGAADIRLFMSLGFTIPVIVRHQAFDVQAQLKNMRVVTVEEGNGHVLLVDIARTGQGSSFGRLTAFWRPNKSSSYQELNFVNNIAVYTELNLRESVGISLTPEQAKTGFYKLVYEGERRYFGNRVFDEIESFIQVQ